MSLTISRARVAGLVACAAFVVAPAAAQAVDYPPPSKPSAKPSKPKGPFKTFKVCKKGKGCIKTISAAVKKANPGDTIKVGNGTYKEQVAVVGRGKKYIKIIGNPKAPAKVVLEGSNKLANGVFVNGADGVTINGLTAKHYKSNGFFVTNVNGYTMTNLRTYMPGVYGLYAFNSIGGTMSNSVSEWANDGAYYVGQTPVQTKPVRTVLKNVVGRNSVLGYSGTNSRYVTITDSKFYNNGAGIVPNALDSEKFPPAEDNVFTRNEIFWNNFNYKAGAPFKIPSATVAGAIPFPVGVGILLYGGRGNKVTGNKIYGNWLVGAATVPAVTLKDPTVGILKNNQVTGNTFGVNGTDKNGVDIAYNGNGSGNCFENNTGVATTLPAASAAAFPGCTPPVNNVEDGEALGKMFSWVTDPNPEAAWVKDTHSSKPGITPLERYTGGVK